MTDFKAIPIAPPMLGDVLASPSAYAEAAIAAQTPCSPCSPCSFTITLPRTYDRLLGWLAEITLRAPEGWTPPGYHVTTCEACGEVTEPYSVTDQRIVHRATGWAMCSPAALRRRVTS